MNLFKLIFLVLFLPLATVTGRRADHWVEGSCQPSGGLDYGTFHSEVVGGKVSYHILMPPSYSRDVFRRFPVIYWLHGTNGSSRGCAGISFVSNFYSSLMRSGRMPESIVVFPNGLDHGMWCDSADGSRRPESMLVLDLIPFIDKNYRTIISRQYRAIEGFSMGGYGAGRIGFKHNELFGAITMYGAGPLQNDFLVEDPKINPIPARRKVFRDVYGADMGYYEANLPSTLALKVLESSSLRSQPSLRIVVGSEDPLLAYNRMFSKKLNEDFGMSHLYTEVPRVGHDGRRVMESCESDTAEFYAKVFGDHSE